MSKDLEEAVGRVKECASAFASLPGYLVDQEPDARLWDGEVCVDAAQLGADLALLLRSLATAQEALDGAHYYIDASDQELADEGITRGDALTRARILRQALEATSQEVENWVID